MKRYLRTAFISLFACVLIFGFVSVSFAAPTLRVYFRRYQIGGTESVDNIPYATLVNAAYNVHLCIVGTDSKSVIFYLFNKTSTDSEDSPLYDTITPDDQSGDGRWKKVDGIEMGRTAEPGSVYRDLNATDLDTNARVYVDCTDTGSNTEDCDWFVYQQIAGTLTKVIHSDVDGNLEIALDVNLVTGKTFKVNGVEWEPSNTSVDGTPASSGSYEGFKVTDVNAGETITAGEIVYMDATSNEWMLTDANVAGEFPAIGMAAESGTNGNPMDVLIQGVVRLDSWSWTAEGVPLYLSETPGGMTETIPSDDGDCVQVVATVLAITNDTILFRADSTWFLDDGT